MGKPNNLNNSSLNGESPPTFSNWNKQFPLKKMWRLLLPGPPCDVVPPSQYHMGPERHGGEPLR